MNNLLWAPIFRFLFGNQLSGSVPRELGQLTSLTSMYGGLAVCVPFAIHCALGMCVAAVLFAAAVLLTLHTRVYVSFIAPHIYRHKPTTHLGHMYSGVCPVIN